MDRAVGDASLGPKGSQKWLCRHIDVDVVLFTFWLQFQTGRSVCVFCV